MKKLTSAAIILSLFLVAFFSAQNKLARKLDTRALRLGMTVEQLSEVYGDPVAQNRNQLIYIFDDNSELIVTLRDDVVSSAQLKYHQPLRIADPEMRRMTLVQMGAEENYTNRPTWFFAGKPEDGLIYKITSDGFVESLTWVPPFSYGGQVRKQLSALLNDFKSQSTSKL